MTDVLLVTICAAALLIALGVLLTLWWQRREFALLRELRQEVQGELVAMEQTRRIHDAYFDARAAMRRPARLRSERLV